MFRCLLLAITALVVFATSAQAQLLDQMLTAQVATTGANKAIDTTQTKAPAGEKLWDTRVFRAQSSGACAPGNSSSISLATIEPGRTHVDVRNTRGEVAITWRFGPGIPASELPFSGVEFSIVNQTRKSELILSTSTVLNTSAIPLSSTRTGIRVPNTLPAAGKTISVSFLDLAPRVLKSGSLLVNSLTMTLSVERGCDALFSIQNVMLLPRDTSGAKRRDLPGMTEATPTVESPETSQGNPCVTDETVPQKVAECEADAQRRGSSCATWKCECVPDTKTNTYFISRSSATLGSSDGKECVNHICGNQPGRCSEWGTCIAPQFYGYEHPLYSISDTVGFSITTNSIDLDCINNKRIPTSEQLCSLTPTQVEQMIAGSVVVGAPCDLTKGLKGVCDSTGRCVPDTKADYYCKSNVNCTPCGAPGNICWGGKCLTKAQASFQLCQSTHYFNTGRGICKPCFATFNLNKDGSCGTGIISSDPRGVNMDGATCWRDYGQVRGACLNGQCVARPTPFATATARPQTSR